MSHIVERESLTPRPSPWVDLALIAMIATVGGGLVAIGAREPARPAEERAMDLTHHERELLALAALYAAEDRCADDRVGEQTAAELRALARRLIPPTQPLPEGSTYTRGAR